jgi:putative redox protein
MGDETTVKVELKQAYGMTLMAKGNSNHWVVMDTAKEIGGNDAGPRPMELMLMALAGCTGMDVISILEKMHVKYDDFRIEITANKSSEHPKVYTKIFIKYRIWGEVSEDKLISAIELSQVKYCSASAMIKKAAEITYDHEIIRK